MIASEKRAGRIPPLQNGDRLTRDEFESRYHAMPHVKKAELIDGEVFMGSPVSWGYHGSQHADLLAWLGSYKATTPGVDAADNATVRLDTENEPQPDATMIILPEYGGRVEIDSDNYLSGSPDFVAEVSASTAGIDLNRKLNVYRRNRVSEYLVWRVYDDAVDWFIFRGGQFDRLAADPADGLLKSTSFPGLWLDAEALIRRDLAAVLAALARGVASPEHASFVKKLASQKKSDR
jgi:Uma2 family endonuclease